MKREPRIDRVLRSEPEYVSTMRGIGLMLGQGVITYASAYCAEHDAHHFDISPNVIRDYGEWYYNDVHKTQQ